MTAKTEPRRCSIARTLEIVDEKLALLAVRELFLGCRRFEEMVHNTGAPLDTLAARLRTLVSAGVLERRRYCDHPPRDEYVLTDEGRDLYPVTLTLMQWGDRHRAAGDGPPLVLEHRCGARLDPVLVRGTCNAQVSMLDVRAVIRSSA